MNKGLLSALLVAVIVVSGGGGYLAGASRQTTTTSTFTVTAPAVTETELTTTTTTFTAQAPGLQLFASVSPRFVEEGLNVSVVVGVYNSLPTGVAVNASEIMNPSQSPCGLGISPTGIEVFQGHYSFANLSAATPLLLYNASGPYPCPVFFSRVYHFLPDSDNTTVFYLGTSTNWVANETIKLKGYWAPSLLAGPGNHHYFELFAPGVYTVLAFDAWGQQTLEYFEVIPPPI